MGTSERQLLLCTLVVCVCRHKWWFCGVVLSDVRRFSRIAKIAKLNGNELN